MQKEEFLPCDGSEGIPIAKGNGHSEECPFDEFDADTLLIVVSDNVILDDELMARLIFPSYRSDGANDPAEPNAHACRAHLPPYDPVCDI